MRESRCAFESTVCHHEAKQHGTFAAIRLPVIPLTQMGKLPWEWGIKSEQMHEKIHTSGDQI